LHFLINIIKYISESVYFFCENPVFWYRKFQGKIRRGVPDVDVRLTAKIELRKIGCRKLNWFKLYQGRIQRQAFFKTAINLRFAYKKRAYWPDELRIDFPREVVVSWSEYI
jgi:hypothetical protein